MANPAVATTPQAGEIRPARTLAAGIPGARRSPDGRAITPGSGPCLLDNGNGTTPSPGTEPVTVFNHYWKPVPGDSDLDIHFHRGRWRVFAAPGATVHGPGRSMTG